MDKYGLTFEINGVQSLVVGHEFGRRISSGASQDKLDMGIDRLVRESLA